MSRIAIGAVALTLTLAGDHARVAAAAPDAPVAPAAHARWSDESPDAMIEDAAARALAPRASTRGQIAALATMGALADRADDGHARGGFDRLAGQSTLPADVRAESALLARSLAPDEGTEGARQVDAKLGMIDALALLGPFRDTGGGLDAHDGPEASGATFGDLHARYSWGSYEVAWRALPPDYAQAAGLPLDVFIFPRKESCTWVATKLTVPSPQKLVIRLAATGHARLVFDGVDLGRDDAMHAKLRFDRLAASVRADAGPHLLATKVCSGAIDDDGRVRLRVTTEAGTWPDGVTASADLGGTPTRTPKSPKLAFDKVATPLARALAEPTAGSDGPLEAAVLRTLGGADDLRSPRAPGILASVADGLDADRLAFAAWIAPSGANRSAWLNRARANASADAGTRAFVERRLVERHVEAGLADWAMATLQAAKLDTSGDAEAVLLTAQVENALGTDALRVRALRRLEAAAARAPQVSDALLDQLADLSTSYDSAVALAARERLAARGYVGSTRVTALEAKGRDAVVAAAHKAFAGGIDDAEDGVAVAEAVGRTGAHPEARALFGQLARWAPNRAVVWSGLARELGAGPSDAQRDPAVAAALRRARELDPGEARYRAELALRVHEGGSSEVHDDEKYLVNADTILARRRGVGRDPAHPEVDDVADRELHWLRAVVMRADRRVSELVHYAREIVIAPRTEDELYEEVPTEGDLTEIVRARVYRRDGGTAFPVEQSSENAKPRIRWPELAPGDVVEVAFRSWTAGPVGGRGDPPFFRLDYAGALSTHPVLYNEVDVESPPDHPIYVDVVNGKPDRRDERDEDGHHAVRLVWDRPVTLPDEPLAPPLSEVLPTVTLSTFRDWTQFRSWYSEAVRGFTEPDAQVRDLAAKLTRGKTTRDAKLQALFDFVADDIRYVNYVSGEWWLPNRPQQLLARREGDCDDKALLLITLLKAAGIDAEEVLVQTRLTGEPSLLRARGAAVPLFDHGIAYLSGPDGGRYLDATSPQSRLGPLPSMDARAVALRMDGPPEIVQLPSSSPDDHGVDSTWVITLRPDGSADLDGEEHATGDDAFWMRTYLTEPGARAQWLEDRLVGGWFPTVEVDKKVDFDGNRTNGAAIVKWRARSSGLARHEGDELVVPLSPAQTTASQLAPLVERTLPVWLPPHIAPRREARTLRIRAPQGWTFAPLPAGGDENAGAFGRAHLEVARDPHDPRTVVVRRFVVFDQSTIGVDEYSKWRAWVQRVDALMHRTVRLIPAVSLAVAPRPSTGGAR